MNLCKICNTNLYYNKNMRISENFIYWVRNLLQITQIKIRLTINKESRYYRFKYANRYDTQKELVYCDYYLFKALLKNDPAMSYCPALLFNYFIGLIFSRDVTDNEDLLFIYDSLILDIHFTLPNWIQYTGVRRNLDHTRQ